MIAITEPARDVPVVADVDVCVVGGGTAGIAAALGAARAGAKTLLIEAHGSLGGQMTLGYVNMIPPWDYTPGAPTFGGVMTELVARLKEQDAYWVRSDSPAAFHRYDVEECKALAVRMLLDGGVGMRLHSWVGNAVLSDGRIRAVISDSVDGRTAVCARSFVDATGDAVLAHVAGATCEVEHIGVSLCAVGYVPDVAAAAAGLAERKGGLRQLLDDNGLRDIRIAFSTGPDGWNWNQRGPGLADMNYNVGSIDGGPDSPDGLDVDVITRIENDGRLRMKAAIDLLRESVPGFADMILVNSSDHLGVRWTRVVKGDYQLSRADVKSGTPFDDNVARWGKAEAPSGLPYRSVYSADLKNLWVGGRCLSAEPDNYAPRIVPCCVASGQAAGTAAALAALRGATARDLDPTDVAGELVRQGVALGDSPARWLQND